MRRTYVAIALVPLLALFATGCSVMSKVFSEPQLSDNYALEGECDVPELVDGSMFSRGRTHPPVYVKGQRPDDSRFTETIVTLKAPKSINRILVRRLSEDSVPVDLDIQVMKDGEWEVIKEVRGTVEDDIKVSVNTVTDKVKIRAQRATRTAKGKVAVTKSNRGGATGRGRRAEIQTLLRDPITLAEIELYGIKTEE